MVFILQDFRSEFQIFTFVRYGIAAMDDESASWSSKLGSFAPKLSDDGEVRRVGVGEKFCQVSAALKAFGITAEELDHIWDLLIALLHLTHIHVAPSTDVV